LFISPAANRVRGAIAASLFGLLAACATTAPVARHQSDDEALDQLRTGKAVLDCGQPCAEAWQRSRTDLNNSYNADDWRQLALNVIHTDYRQDLAYYYLGRAAEGLGDSSAALAYYQTAQALATGPVETAKCVASSDGCNGLSLLTEVLTRIQIVDAQRSRSAWTARRHQHSQPGPGQPADAPAQQPGGNWVDPPPATP
jgi:hypothetical protein